MKLFTTLSPKLRLLMAVSALSFGGVMSLPVWAAVNGVEDMNEVSLSVAMGKGQLITIPGNVSDVMIANPKVADVSAIQADKLYIVGTSIGGTNIMVLDNSGNLLRSFNVEVNLNTAEIERQVHKIFPQEKDVSIQLIGNQVALTGLVSTPGVSTKIAKLVAAQVQEMIPGQQGAQSVNEVIENLLEVRGEQQVMLRVRIVEMSRNVLRELGSEISSLDPTATGGSGLRGTINSNNDTGLTQTPYTVASLLFNTGIGGIGDLNMLINLLEQDNLANTLAEPNLTAISGEEAGFLAGGEFPVPAGRDQQGNVTIDYKKFGVSLNFKPLVLSDDRITLQLNTEVSSLNEARGITLVDVSIPGLDVRRASTTVEMNSGGSLMIAGLLKSDNTKGLNGIPGIRDTPVLGDLLSSKSFQRNETELVVIVTPYLVSPYADNTQATPVKASELGMMAPSLPPAGLMAPGKNGKPAVPPIEQSLLEDKDEPVIAAKTHTVVEKNEIVETVEEPIKLDTPLNKVFSKNMKQIYGQKLKEMPNKDQTYGYMLD